MQNLREFLNAPQRSSKGVGLVADRKGPRAADRASAGEDFKAG
jgi:hypothetical protein